MFSIHKHSIITIILNWEYCVSVSKIAIGTNEISYQIQRSCGHKAVDYVPIRSDATACIPSKWLTPYGIGREEVLWLIANKKLHDPGHQLC